MIFLKNINVKGSISIFSICDAEIVEPKCSLLMRRTIWTFLGNSYVLLIICSTSLSHVPLMLFECVVLAPKQCVSILEIIADVLIPLHGRFWRNDWIIQLHQLLLHVLDRMLISRDRLMPPVSIRCLSLHIVQYLHSTYVVPAYSTVWLSISSLINNYTYLHCAITS